MNNEKLNETNVEDLGIEAEESKQEGFFQGNGNVDTKELAEQALASNVELNAALAREHLASGQKYEEVKKTIEAEKQDPKEEARQRRQAYDRAGFKLLIDLLEEKMNKGIFGRGFVPKSELKEQIVALNLKSEKDDGLGEIVWQNVVRQANFLDDKKVLAQLEAMKSEYLKPGDEDLSSDASAKKSQITDQIVASSMGASGDRVSF